MGNATLTGFYLVPSPTLAKLLTSWELWLCLLVPYGVLRWLLCAYHSWILSYEAVEKDTVVTPISAKYFAGNKAAIKATKKLRMLGWELVGSYVGKTNTTLHFLLFHSSAVGGVCFVFPSELKTFVDFFVLEEGERWLRVHNIPASMAYNEEEVRDIPLLSASLGALEERFREERQKIVADRFMGEEPLEVFLRLTEDGNRMMRETLLRTSAWEHVLNSLLKPMVLVFTAGRIAFALFFLWMLSLGLPRLGFLAPVSTAKEIEQTVEKKLKRLFASPKLRSSAQGLASIPLKLAHMTEPVGFLGEVVMTFEYTERNKKRYVELTAPLADIPHFFQFHAALEKVSKPRGLTYPRKTTLLIHLLVPLLLFLSPLLLLFEFHWLRKKRAKLLANAALPHASS